MKTINRWQCWIMTIIDSIKVGYPFNFTLSGHEYVEVETIKNATVVITKCERCGKIDISWSRNAPQ